MTAPAHAHLIGDPTAREERSFGAEGRFLRSRSIARRAYLLPMLGIVLLVVGLSAAAFARAPVPPGVDPGHWLSISYGYVGLPSAPDPTDQPLFYSPLLFPFLGGLVVATGSPLLAADLTAIGLFLLYGLTVVHLARRYLASGPLQVALVGLGTLSGTTLQMLFWGGYPNLLGFVLLNEALLLLLAFVRSRRAFDGALFYGLVGATYFAHDLSAFVLFAVTGVAALFLLLFRKIDFAFLLRPINVVSLVALGIVIGGYSEATSHLGIAHPSYFSANPSAYVVDEVGELFAPLAHAPVAGPAGAAVYLPPEPTAILLVLAPLVALVGLLLVRRRSPSRLDTRLVIAAAWLATALAIPGAGYLAHVDTDFTRFLYFLPLPFFLLLLLAIERAFAPALIPAVAPEPGPLPTNPVAPGPGGRRVARPGGANPVVVAAYSVAIVLGFVFVTVTVPVVEGNEVASTATAHDAAFLQVAQWLKQNPTAGRVLTVPSAARWTEALSDRDALTVGPVWLLFDPFQITDAEESYWALTSEYTVENSQAALAFSGEATPVMSQAPMYTVYDQGIPFPVVRVLPGTLALTASGPNGSTGYPLTATGTFPGGGAGGLPPNVTVTYRSSVASVVEVGTALSDGSMRLHFEVTPDAGTTVRSLTVGFATPPSDSSTLATDSVASTSVAGSTMTIGVTGKLGQYPDPAQITSTIHFSGTPTWSSPNSLTLAGSETAVFADPNGSGRFGLEVAFASVGASGTVGPLPAMLSTPTFLQNRSIAFLLWPNQTYGSVEIQYYEATFGFRQVYANPEWIVLGT